MANEVINSTPSFQDDQKRTPIEIFANTKVSANPKHWKPFGCPAYVLESALQSNKPFHKWQQRSKVGVYIGKSPQHGRNVALVFDRETGLASPQFHVAFDPTVETVQDIKTKSRWQIKAGFVAQKQSGPPKQVTDKAESPQATTTLGEKKKTSIQECTAQLKSAKRHVKDIVNSSSQPERQNKEGESKSSEFHHHCCLRTKKYKQKV
jgi:hypothetical protein